MPENVTLTDAMLVEIEARGTSFLRDVLVIATLRDTPEDAQIAADYDTLIAALRASRERERRLRETLEQIHDYCYGEYREGEKGFQPAIIARAALIEEAPHVA